MSGTAQPEIWRAAEISGTGETVAAAAVVVVVAVVGSSRRRASASGRSKGRCDPVTPETLTKC